MSRLGLYTRFNTHEDQRETLVQILLRAAADMTAVDGCQCYVVNVTEDDPDTVWVTELWADEAAHQASLATDASKALIQQARPLITSVEQIKLRPVGGKGIS